MEKKKQQSTSYLPTQAGIDVLYTFISTLLEETIRNFYWMLLHCAAASIYLAMLIQSATLHSFISVHITETSQVSSWQLRKLHSYPKDLPLPTPETILKPTVTQAHSGPIPTHSGG